MRSLFLYLLFTSGNGIYYLLPLFSDAFKKSDSYSSIEMALLLSIELFIKPLAIIFSQSFLPFFLRKRCLIAIILLMASCNLLSAFFTNFMSLFSLRLLVGLLSAALAMVVYHNFSQADNPEREYSLSLLILIAVGAISLGAFSLIPATIPALFTIVFLISIAPLFLLLFLGKGKSSWEQAISTPQTRKTQESDSQSTAPVLPLNAILCLLAIFVFFAAMNVVWVDFLNLGSIAGMSSDKVAALLSMSLIFSFLGAALAVKVSLTNTPWQYRLLFLPLLLILLSLLIYFIAPGRISFYQLVIVFDFLYAFAIPFQAGLVSNFDRSGRGALFIPAVQGTGLTLGAFLSAKVAEHGSLQSIFLSVLLILLASTLWVFLRFQTRMTSNTDVNYSGN